MKEIRFRCITISKTETIKGFIVNAVKEDGVVQFFTYKKKSNIDSMNLVDVVCFKKRNDFLIVKDMHIIDRFEKIRNSFELLSFALFIMEITFKTNSRMNILFNALKILSNDKPKIALVWFLANFLIQNGIFNENGFSPQEKALINFIRKTSNISNLKIDDVSFYVLLSKLFKNAKEYIGDDFSNNVVWRFLKNENSIAKG